MMASVTIIVPVFHNARSLGELLSRLQACADRNPTERFEFLFVDDGSGDDSFEVLQELARADERVTVVKLSRNFGSMAALQAGLAHARGDAVGAIAADLQDPPELLDDMLRHWRQGSKVVVAARRHRGDPWTTRLLADTFYTLFRRFALPAMPKHGFDFFLIDRSVRDLLVGIEENHVYLMGLLLWLGFQPVVVPYDRQERARRHGRSMWTLSKKLAHFADAFASFSPAPLRLLGLGGALALCAGGIGLVGMATTWMFGMAAAGWLWLLPALAIVGGINLVAITVLGEYVWRNLEETRRRPRFVVDSVTSTCTGEQRKCA